MGYFRIHEGGLLFRRRQETVYLLPWGENGLRVRATENSSFTEHDWALLPAPSDNAVIEITETGATITNGKIRAVITEYGKIRYYNQRGELLLREFYRCWDRGKDWKNKAELDQIIMQRYQAREFRANPGENYALTVRFEPNDNEHIFGMGQYQHPYLDLKGCTLDLHPCNTQASVPFAISSLGYGFLWNNPGVGKVTFAKNITEWSMESTKQIDYWICAGDTPAQIEEDYARVTGTVPMMPEYAMGFWQCKLRYQTQDELMAVAREYYRRKLPLKVIVIDFFHWPHQGDWRFDERYWPDPAGMVRELNEMGIMLMVSVWPTVDFDSENYQYMLENDYLIRNDRGMSCGMDCLGVQTYFDPTNADAREFVWSVIKKNYWDKGIHLFWLDVAEPEYTVKDFDIYRYKAGSALETANYFPMAYAQTFYDGLRKEGVESPLSLIRCAWAGSQRFGALAWSGDVPSTFVQMRNQISAGLNMGLAGITWWTADIGGFHGAYIDDPDFHELLARWFQFGTFCPVMRLHGDRLPHSEPLGKDGGGLCDSGAANEIWSFTPELEKLMTHYILQREALKPYIVEIMREAHEKGTPVIKPLFYDFPEDMNAWKIEDQYLFGHDFLVCPVTVAYAREKRVYLPEGAQWREALTGRVYEGGIWLTVDAPLDRMPLFTREGSGAEKFLI